MRVFIVFCCAVFTLIACKKEQPCLDSTLKEFKASPNAIAIRIQVVNGETHYWLQSTASSMDLGDSIINEDCEPVCVMCAECPWIPCMYDYDEKQWETIWEK